jgi:hypothetical protein
LLHHTSTNLNERDTLAMKEVETWACGCVGVWHVWTIPVPLMESTGPGGPTLDTVTGVGSLRLVVPHSCQWALVLLSTCSLPFQVAG